MLKKTRGEQFFFVNNRFVKAHYLHHAIMNSLEGLMQKDMFISYFIFLKVDTQRIDINVHPSKTETKVEDLLSEFNTLIMKCCTAKAPERSHVSRMHSAM